MGPMPEIRSFPKLQCWQMLDPVQEAAIVSLSESGTRLLDEDPSTGLMFGKKTPKAKAKPAK